MRRPNRPSWLILLALLSTILLAYFWLQSPALSQFSVQLFALCVLAFFAIKLFLSKKQWQFLPDPLSLEIVPLTLGVCLLVGSTGGLLSPFFPAHYAHLFLLVLAVPFWIAGLAAGAILLMHYATTPDIGLGAWEAIIFFPLLLILFSYVKDQVMTVREQQTALSKKDQELQVVTTDEMNLEGFMRTFLLPKLQAVSEVGQLEETTKKTLLNQLLLLYSEVEKLLQRLTANQNPQAGPQNITDSPDADDASPTSAPPSVPD